ncbi:hypothetical protein GND96_04245 [Citrobacter sp. JL976]|uniref:transposase domain-containing protein n=2 Tax=Citrobacter TaxID=544 RepID=UPI000CDEF27A|nr:MULTISPECIES: transposase domain-containing protein [Citrobacter]MDU3462731.1 transposase domain-containing protein [Citrobacter sp.]MTW54622.1 hypothetical protein [Citrobacter sp. JL976]POZ45032.1 hypothetical protein CF017_23575 [Citrobacter braakii]TCC74172.1 transposase domain-containing protein [Citrobacter braakii]
MSAAKPRATAWSASTVSPDGQRVIPKRGWRAGAEYWSRMVMRQRYVKPQLDALWAWLTARLNGVEPYGWLKSALKRLPSLPEERQHELLPFAKNPLNN